MTDPTQWTVRLHTIVGGLTLDVTMDHFNVWIAQVRGMPGCIGDGSNKMEAIQNAVILYLHVLILRIQREEWTPRLVKQPDP